MANTQKRPPRVALTRVPGQAAGDGLVVLNGDGVFLSANEAACRLLGLDLHELKGRSFLEPAWQMALEHDGGGVARTASGPGSPSILRPCTSVPMSFRNARSGARQTVALSADPTFEPATGKLSALVVTLSAVPTRRKAADAFLGDRQILGDVTTYANCAFLILDQHARVEYANPLAAEWFGRGPDIVGKACGEALALEDDAPLCVAWEALHTGKVARGDDFEMKMGGEGRFFRPLAMPIRDESDRVRQVGLLVLDVTERRRAERWVRNALGDLRQRGAGTSMLPRNGHNGHNGSGSLHAAEHGGAVEALRDSEERYRSVVAVLEEGIIVWDRDGSVVECNASAERILGAKRDQLIGRGHGALDWEAYLEDGSPVPEDLHPVIGTLRTGKPCSGFVMGVSRGRSGLAWVSINSRPLFRQGDPVPYGAVTSFSDITHRKTAEEQMSVLGKHIRLLLESTDVGVFGIDLQGRCTFLNSYGAKLLGHEPDAVLGKDIHSLIHQPGRDGRECRSDGCALLSVLKTGTGIRGGDHLFWRADGTPLDVDFSCYPIVDEEIITGAVVTFLDIGQRKKTEDAWVESQAQLAEAQRLAHLGSYCWDVLGRIITCSDEARHVLELDPGSGPLSVRRCLELVHPDDRLQVRDTVCHAISAGRGYSLECRIVSGDGRDKHVQILGKAHVDVAGSVTSITGTVMDVTERKQLEERLLRAQRLETAGRIAGQVAHDFNNMLAPLALYPDLLKMQLPENHAAVRYCDGMLEVVQQMADINGDLLTLGRRGHIEPQAVDLNRVVRQAVEQLMEKPETLVVALGLAGDLTVVKGSSAQLLRVVTNLVWNAREAMQDVGTLVISTANVYVDEPFGSYEQVQVGEYVRLTVRDTGQGIPAAIRDRIFDAFFTTKLANKRPGTGLGLSIVLAVVEDHHGYLDVESSKEGGTTFSVYLPVCRERPEEIRPAAIRGGHESILIVDDDRALREAVGEILSRLGYRAEMAESGEAAMACAAEHPADLLILDMTMPAGIDGTETYRRISEARPEQKAIIMSGFAESERVREAMALGAGAFLRKPVSMEKLARAVREELDRV